MSPGVGRTFEFVGAVLSIIAGGYLLARNGSAIAGGQSGFVALAHGIGLYFLARGVWMLGQVGMQRSSTEALERLVDLHGGWPNEEESRPTAPSERLSQ